ncbi:twin-arginine translocase TatA/TatE family subunit [Nitrospinae bacterium AH_259_B05_G02_I21]|nr:twin-arginine translocase TatA/TatE family subunit [Nitrospinae bacterium AH_259_B05_G02_I21]MDA2932699.1 twin-arginine translocase TatA/TatE family subunit [Nitrospinae bacterium AH-259-F20]
MFGLGMQELIIILVIALLVFGANKLPEIGRGLGRGIREFRKASSELTDAPEETEEPAKPPAAAEEEEKKMVDSPTESPKS